MKPGEADSDWRPVPGFPRYWASQWGKVEMRARHPMNPYDIKTAMVPDRDDGRGYRCIDLQTSDGGYRTRKLHRIVWAAFNGRQPEKSEHVDHIDHDKANNSISNLRLRDPSENSADCAKGSRLGARRLDEQQRRMVAMLCLAGFGTKAVADLVGIGESTTRRIKKQADSLIDIDDIFTGDNNDECTDD